MGETPAGSLEEEDQARASTWISRGLEALVTEHPDVADGAADARWHFDFVIVGSGYGGAVAAAELAHCAGSDGNRPSICILERGSEYLSGMFPQRMADLAGLVRFATPEGKTAKGVLDGLFDMRIGPDANAIMASGLGGGSLINAGVMEMPHPSVFQEPRWPAEIRRDATLDRLGQELKRRLGAKPAGTTTRKYGALEKLAQGNTFHEADITVAPADGSNSGNTLLDKCNACGDCATGCNYNAKDSLDLNLLRVAHAAGAKIYTGATVLRLERLARDAAGWIVVVNHTNEHLRVRQKKAFRVRARRVILCAGTFGSTEILMRSQDEHLRFSAQLGKKFSTNGDMVAVLYDTGIRINAIANERQHAPRRHVGPTITAMIDRRTGDPDTDVVIQDLSVPGALRRLFEETVTSADALQKLLVPDPDRHAPQTPFLDSAAVDPAAAGNSLTVVMIGRDSADGLLERRDASAGDAADGLLTVNWPALRNDPRFDSQHEALAELLRTSSLGGCVITNPLWRPLSKRLGSVFGAQRGPLLTVHPLGGCPMGDDADSGVVDDCGRVFDADQSPSRSVHEGLFVLDGSIVPTSLGINPSLTIAVLALRAMANLRSTLSTDWPHAQPEVMPPIERRPVFLTPRQFRPARTQIEVTEQLVGKVFLDGDPALHPGHELGLTVTYASKAVAELMARKGDKRVLRVDKKGGKGILRIKSIGPGQEELVADVSGTLRIFHRGTSAPLTRRIRGLRAWLLNRGLRDIVQSGVEAFQRWLKMQPPLETKTQGALGYLLDIVKLSDHAGSVRLLEYTLTISNPQAGTQSGLSAKDFDGKTIKGYKRLTYARASNPWLQLQELALHDFPRMERRGSMRALSKALYLACSSGFVRARDRYLKPAVLKVNLDYLVGKGVPLLRIVQQQDRPSALVDLLSFALYLARIELQIHALSFRKPDPPTDREPVRLPGSVERLPSPQIEWLVVGRKSDGKPIWIRLARYRDKTRVAYMKTERDNPVLLIHGYSASGTTFAHAEVKGNLAETLCKAGRDVWIIDMRSSAGMPTATDGWAFEDVALVDIRRAIEHILSHSAANGDAKVKVDVVAHCMGSAMFSMALLADTEPPNFLHESIGRVVLSQVGPVLKLSTANVFRAYVMRYVRQFLPLSDYSFRPEGKAALGHQLLDRVLATLPYPRAEYALENPLWPPGVATPWAMARHRMDALYARTFNLANMSSGVLDHIDDFFGPLSVETVSQVIHFARFQTITDRTGFNRYAVPFRLQSRLIFPILYIHGEDNGLTDVATLDLMRDKLEDAGIEHLNAGRLHVRSADAALALIDSGRHAELQAEGKGSLMTWCIANHGHQDALIGKHAGTTSNVIACFLGPRKHA